MSIVFKTQGDGFVNIKNIYMEYYTKVNKTYYINGVSIVKGYRWVYCIIDIDNTQLNINHANLGLISKYNLPRREMRLIKKSLDIFKNK